MTFLWNSYRIEHEPDGDYQTEEDFAMAAAATATYYSCRLQSKNDDLKHMWTTPPPVVETLVDSTGADTERFSSPLNASVHLTRHYSYRKADGPV